MTDLQVDFDKLQSSHDVAVTLHDRFQGLPRDVASSRDIWGDTGIRDAMKEFATNWDYRRTVICTNLEEYAEKANACLEGFSKADEELRKSLEQRAEESA